MTTPTPGAPNVISQTNAPPMLTAIGNKTVDEGALLTFTILATDPNAPPQTLTFSLDAGAPMNASIHPGTGVFSWIPNEAQGPGTYSVTARVTDNGIPPLSAVSTFTVQVNEVNNAPTLASIGDRTLTEGATLLVTNRATDPDNPAQALTFTLDSGAPPGMILTPDGVLSWTPEENQGPGIYSITLRVTDNGEPPLSDTKPFTVTVLDANTAPMLAPLSDRSVVEGLLLTFTASATDADLPAQQLSYSLDPGAPPGASIDPNSGVFTWVPTEAQGPSSNTVTVRVTDNGIPPLSDTKTVLLTVTETNAEPSLANLSDKSVLKGKALSFSVSATDTDQPPQRLSFTLEPGAPIGAQIDATNGVFTWTPNATQGPSTNVIGVRVTDDGIPPLSDTKSFTVIVTETNAAPLLDMLSDKTVMEGTLLTFTNSATDTDLPSQRLTFTLEAGAPMGAQIDPTNGVFSWLPSETQGPSTNIIGVRVTDDGIPPLSDMKTFTVIVTETNAAPVLAPLSDSTNYAGVPITFTVNATDADWPANVLTFSLGPGAPSTASIGATNGLFAWTPNSDQAPSTNIITIRVTDDGVPVLSDSRSVTIVIAAPITISRLTESGGVVTLEWTSIPGRTYRVQYKTHLNESEWTSLGGPVSATGLTASMTDNLAGNNQRFYRVTFSPQP
jgi:hypothetical protein